jgi:hypothetical protein
MRIVSRSEPVLSAFVAAKVPTSVLVAIVLFKRHAALMTRILKPRIIASVPGLLTRLKNLHPRL